MVIFGITASLICITFFFVVFDVYVFVFFLCFLGGAFIIWWCRVFYWGGCGGWWLFGCSCLWVFCGGFFESLKGGVVLVLIHELYIWIAGLAGYIYRLCNGRLLSIESGFWKI